MPGGIILVFRSLFFCRVNVATRCVRDGLLLREREWTNMGGDDRVRLGPLAAKGT